MTQQETNIKKMIPRYEGTLRKHILRVPEVIRECSGIVIFGRRIKSVAFTTDLCIVRNMDADAVLAVYPFTPQPIITQALLLAADIPVFAGVGGGLTTGRRVTMLAGYAEVQGATAVVMNAPTSNEILAEVAKVVDIPAIITIVNDHVDFQSRVEAGAAIFNVAAGANTPELVRKIRRELPEFPVIATAAPPRSPSVKPFRRGPTLSPGRRRPRQAFLRIPWLPIGRTSLTPEMDTRLPQEGRKGRTVLRREKGKNRAALFDYRSGKLASWIFPSSTSST